MTKPTIGQRLSPILNEIEETLWDHEVLSDDKPDYTIEGFRSAAKIFMSAMMDKMWELQDTENMTIDQRVLMAEKAGNELRAFIKTYTDIDTVSLYDNNEAIESPSLSIGGEEK